jgi:hypothetical protein
MNGQLEGRLYGKTPPRDKFYEGRSFCPVFLNLFEQRRQLFQCLVSANGILNFPTGKLGEIGD